MSRRNAWIYPAGWLALLTIYAAALVGSGVALNLALRNALASLLPDALLGLFLLRLPSFLPWPDSPKGRFFASHLELLAAFIVIAAAGWIALVEVDSLLFTGHAARQIDYRHPRTC